MKLSWHNIHLVLTLFFAPLILCFALTGALYMTNIDKNFTSTVTSYTFEKATHPTAEAVIAELKEKRHILPEGLPVPLKQNLILGKSTQDHVLFTDKKNTIIAEIISPGPYPKLLLVHKGKAGPLFMILSWGCIITLFIAYLSGILLMWKNRKKKSAMIMSFSLGMLTLLIGYFLL